MGNVRLYGATSGYTELAPPAVAPDGVLTLPTGTGTIAKTTDQGLVHINTTTFSAVSSVSVNSCFSSTYDNYLVVLRSTVGAGVPLRFRMRVAGVDASGATDYLTGWIISTSGSAIDYSTASSAGTSSGYLMQHQFVGNASTNSIISSPFLTAPTLCVSTVFAAGTTRADGGTSYTQHNPSTSYDGFTLFPSSGTITGTIRVYGYKNEAS